MRLSVRALRFLAAAMLLSACESDETVGRFRHQEVDHYSSQGTIAPSAQSSSKKPAGVDAQRVPLENREHTSPAHPSLSGSGSTLALPPIAGVAPTPSLGLLPHDRRDKRRPGVDPELEKLRAELKGLYARQTEQRAALRKHQAKEAELRSLVNATESAVAQTEAQYRRLRQLSQPGIDL